VLVVDDNRDAADTLARLLRLAGHEVRVCNDGPAALATVEFQPQVVLLDIGLPGMDGYEGARQLPQQPGLGNMLLVGLTGYSQEEEIRRSWEAGFDHHLVKPADWEKIIALFAALNGNGMSQSSAVVNEVGKSA